MRIFIIYFFSRPALGVSDTVEEAKSWIGVGASPRESEVFVLLLHGSSASMTIHFNEVKYSMALRFDDKDNMCR